MSIFLKLDLEQKENILKIFMLELVKLSKPSDRDKFIFKSLKEHLHISKEVIDKLKIEIKNQVDSERIDGLLDLDNLMMKIKAEVANKMHPDQAQELLKSLFDLFNVAGNLNQTFLENLCSSYIGNKINSQIEVQKEVEDLYFDPEPILNESSESVSSDQTEGHNKALVNNIESLDEEANESKINSEFSLSGEPSSSSENPKIETTINEHSMILSQYSDFIQKLLFPARDAMILGLKIDIGDPIAEDIENNIASPEIRLIATAIDFMVLLLSLIIPILIIIILSIFLQTLGLESIALGFTLIPGFTVFFYYLKLETTSSSTLGKQWMGLKVCSFDGKPISKKLIVIRSLLRSSPLFLSSIATIVTALSDVSNLIFAGLSLLSWLLIILSVSCYCIHQRTQGIHDLISKSIVIRHKQLPK